MYKTKKGVSDTVTSELRNEKTWPSAWLLANAEQCKSPEAGMCSAIVRSNEGASVSEEQ